MSDELIKRLKESRGQCSDCNMFETASDLNDAIIALESANDRIAELEAAMRKQANAARCLADATIRDASIRQELAEKARAESSPEVLASERQANAMLTEENERLTARISELEAQIATVAPAVDALIDALRAAEDALESCYDVTEFPCSGKSKQDVALETVRAALSQHTGEKDD